MQSDPEKDHGGLAAVEGEEVESLFLREQGEQIGATFAIEFLCETGAFGVRNNPKSNGSLGVVISSHRAQTYVVSILVCVALKHEKPMPNRSHPKKRNLTRERVLAMAIKLADANGLESLSMRGLGRALGVEAMSLYNHVANKEDLLDGIVEQVVAEISDSTGKTNWKSVLRSRAVATHQVLLRRPWVAGLLESRTNLGHERLRHCDSMIGILRNAGFSVELAYQAFLTVDSYVHGFAFQESNRPVDANSRPSVLKKMLKKIPAEEFPHITEIIEHVVESSNRKSSARTREFEFGLKLILNGLEEHRSRARRRKSDKAKSGR